jgi:hypothetical protein
MNYLNAVATINVSLNPAKMEFALTQEFASTTCVQNASQKVVNQPLVLMDFIVTRVETTENAS